MYTKLHMELLHNIVNRARLRMQLNTTLSKSSQFVLILVSLLLFIAILDRIGTHYFVLWNYVWICSGALFGLIWMTLWVRSTIPLLEAATEVDQRMELHNRISSALVAEHDKNPFSVAVVDDAIATVDSKKVMPRLAEFFPITTPKKFGSAVLVALLVSGVLWSPQWGWWNDNNQKPNAVLLATNDNIESSIDAVLEELEDNELLSEALEDELAELAAMNMNPSLDSETMRIEALKNITDVQKRLEELMKDENALAYEEMLRRMQALKMPQNSNLQPMVADMKNGNFDQAKKEFERLQDQLESQNLSDEERQQLAKSLEKLAEQLQKLSQSNGALASALSAAGMNANLANNPEAAMKAIQNAKDLTEEQKKKLLELLEAQKKASQMCKKMGEGCKQCAGGKGGAGMESELEKLKAMQMFKTKAQIAKIACQNAAAGMCSGAGKGSGTTGGEGNGNGGSNATLETETASVAERSPVQTLEGTIIARQLFEGGLLTTGESTAEVRERVLAQQRDAEQAIVDEEVPRRYHDLLRHYFGQLEQLTEPSDADDTDTSG